MMVTPMTFTVEVTVVLWQVPAIRLPSRDISVENHENQNQIKSNQIESKSND